LVAVSLISSGPRLEAAEPERLFTLPPGAVYEAAPDGQRFLITALTKEASPITVLLNWKPRQQLP
jgi:hypothetical protein